MPTVNLRDTSRYELVNISPAYRHRIEFGDMSYPGLMEPAEITFTTRTPHSPGRCVDVLLPGGLRSKGFVTSVVEPIDGLCKETIKLSGAPTRDGFLASAMQASATQLARRIRESVAIDLETLPHPMCRSIISDVTAERIGLMKEKPVKIRNKFYVAAPSVTTHSEQDQENTSDKVHLSMSPNDRSGKWTRKTVQDAVAHAEQMLADNAKLEHVAIVKIVKVVRRPKPKFIIEDVK